MKKCIFLCLIVLIGTNYAEAQKLKAWKKPEDKGQLHFDSIIGLGDINSLRTPSDESIQYSIYRLQISEPPYGLTKVRALCYSLQAMEDKPFDTSKITIKQKLYCQLSLREKFTYNMIHPEWYRQICSSMPIIVYEDTKIFAQLPDPFAEHGWSEQQSKFFVSHRDSVILYLKDCITKGFRVGVNFKKVIIDINAKELIPVIISIYNAQKAIVSIYDVQKKDHDILTVLMLLMKNNGYKPFLASDFNKYLYTGERASYKSYLDLTLENEALIIKLANEFYKGLGN